MKIGCHVGMVGPEYYLGSVKEAISYGANTFMLYTGAPQNSFRTPLENLNIYEALDMMKKNNIDINNIVVHAPYLINLGNLDQEKSKNSYNMLLSEINRTLKMGCRYLVLHPGASMGYDREESLNQVAYYLNAAIEKYPGIIILIETMAGKGSELGINFNEINYIIQQIKHKECIGVCLDTCHINDAGYDLNKIDDVLNEFDNIIGLNYLYVCHINDSKNEKGAHKDRHENIGLGKIGFDNLINFIYNPRISDRIFILETPYVKENEKDKISYPPYKFEIEMILSKNNNLNLKEDIINYYKNDTH